jgi:hypothetical protein
VARHVDGCETCSENRTRVASPLALLAAAPLVPAPSLLKARVISSIRNVEVVDGPHVPFTKDGFAVLDAGGAERSPKAAWIVAAAAIVIVLLGVFAFRGDGGDDGSVLAGGSATSTTRARLTTGDSATIPTIPVETSTLADLGSDEGSDDGSGATGTTLKGDKTTTTVKGGGTNTTATTKPGDTTTTTLDDAGPSVIGASMTHECVSADKQIVRVSIHATDPSGVRDAKLLSPSIPMSDPDGDGVWTGEKELPATQAISTTVIQVHDTLGHSNNATVGPLGPCVTTTVPRPA